MAAKYPDQTKIALDFLSRSRPRPLWKRFWPWTGEEIPGLETDEEMEVALKAFFTFAGPVGKDFYNYLMNRFYDVPTDQANEVRARDMMLEITTLVRVGYLRAKGLAKTDEELEDARSEQGRPDGRPSRVTADDPRAAGHGAARVGRPFRGQAKPPVHPGG